MSILRLFSARTCLFALICVPAAGARADVTLKWSGKPGETLKYAFSQVQEVKTTVQGLVHSSKSNLAVDLTWTVKAIAADGAIEVGLVADRVRVGITADGRIIAYDSGDKNADGGPEVALFKKLYEAMIGKTYTLKISPQGEIIDVKVPDAAIAAVGGTPFAATVDGGSFHSAAGVKNMLAQIMPTMPKEPVRAGSTWKSDLTLPTGPLSTLLQSSFTVTDPSTLARIESKIETAVKSPAESPITIKMNKQNGTGKFTFDAGGGHIADASIDQSFDMTLKDSQREVPQTMVLGMTLKLVR